MLTAFIAALGLAAAYLGFRWQQSKAENTELRGQIASLKRQLAQSRR